MSSSAAALVASLCAESGPLAHLRARAAALGRRVGLPEAEDQRVIDAAVALVELGIVRPVLIGTREEIERGLESTGAAPGAVPIIDPEVDPRREGVRARLLERRGHKGLTADAAEAMSRRPLEFATGLVAMGALDAVVAGATHATAEVLRAGLWQIGLRRGVRTLSGAFLMVPPVGHLWPRPLLFADAAVVPEPDFEALVEIGAASAETFARLFGRPARVACLSFSTLGSADHPAARRMAAVAARLREAGIEADGELQLDAALVPEVAATKAAGSTVAGSADVLLFPDLAAANIGYKLVERIAGLRAIGPLVQGLRQPVYDLSRGCDARAIVDTAALAALDVPPGGVRHTAGVEEDEDDRP